MTAQNNQNIPSAEGFLSEGWEMRKLGEVCDIKTGKKDVNEGNPDGQYPFFTCSRKFTFSDNYSFDTQALLIAGNGDVGHVQYYEGKFEAYQRTYILDKFQDINPHLLHYYIKGFLREKLSSQVLGSAIPYIKVGMLKNFEVIFPKDINEQTRIVTKLDGLFEHIDASMTILAENITATDAMTASVLDETFNHEVLPEGWEMKKLGDIAKTQSGGTPRREKTEYWNGGIPWLKSGELSDNLNIESYEETISQDGLVNSSAKIFTKGTLLMAMYGATAGKLGILGIDASTNQAVCSIQNDKGLFIPKFLYHYLYSNRPQILSDCFGGAQPNISKGYIDQIQIPLPPLSEQTRIVERLDTIFTEAKALKTEYQTRLRALKDLKASILASAFRGEV